MAGNMNALKERLSTLQAKCRGRLDRTYPLIVIQEAGLDAYSLHRALEINGIESHVVDPASIATSWRRRRAKTDNIDGEALLRALLAYKRGDPRVCAMVHRLRRTRRIGVRYAENADYFAASLNASQRLPR